MFNLIGEEGNSRVPDVPACADAFVPLPGKADGGSGVSAAGERCRRLFFMIVSLLLHVAVFAAFSVLSVPKQKEVIEISLLEFAPFSASGPPSAAGNAGQEKENSASGGIAKKIVGGEARKEALSQEKEQSLAPGPRPQAANLSATQAASDGERADPDVSGLTGTGGAVAEEGPAGDIRQGAAGEAGGDSGRGNMHAGGGPHSLAPYLQLVRERIANCKKYPSLARRRHLQGRVGVRFLLAGTGEAREISVSASSGQEILDRAALKAVQDAAPFPLPPAGLFDEAPMVELNIVFELS